MKISAMENDLHVELEESRFFCFADVEKTEEFKLCCTVSTPTSSSTPGRNNSFDGRSIGAEVRRFENRKMLMQNSLFSNPKSEFLGGT